MLTAWAVVGQAGAKPPSPGGAALPEGQRVGEACDYPFWVAHGVTRATSSDGEGIPLCFRGESIGPREEKKVPNPSVALKFQKEVKVPLCQQELVGSHWGKLKDKAGQI